MARILGTVFVIILVAAGLVFAVLNSGFVTLNYGIGTWDMPLSLLLVLSMALGALLGVVASMGAMLRLRREAHRLRHQVQVAEKEVLNLRSIPIKNPH